MKQMSSQLTREYWTYLQDQVESHEQAYFQATNDHAYRDELRASAETYDWLAKEFSLAFSTEGGQTAEGTREFLNLLDQKIQHFVSAQEQTRRKKQAALAKAPAVEYHPIRRMYQEMENRLGCELTAYRDSREHFLSILVEG
ncbi:MAG TPA: hypothetical protein VK249_20885 [Anaerolineales bacterium]|nr:hypothetical protein [Anaerolineales bacterium]